VTLTDITDQKAAERLLRESDRKKDEFLAVLGHELRNALGPVRNANQILDRPMPARTTCGPLARCSIARSRT
jgi:nitrogen-specific signal transduction histidine kinase